MDQELLSVNVYLDLAFARILLGIGFVMVSCPHNPILHEGANELMVLIVDMALIQTPSIKSPLCICLHSMPCISQPSIQIMEDK